MAELITRAPQPHNHHGAVDAGGGKTLLLRSVTEQLTGWDNPELRLRQAISNDEFRLFCQQFVDVKNSGKVCPYYEILIRLQEEESNLTPPGSFIPVAEHYNMTTDIDRWVVRNVINWHHRNRRDTALWRDPMYSLNLFSSTLGDAGYCEYIRKLLRVSEAPPQVLCFEIGEDDVAKQPDVAARFSNELRQAGCRVALGGFRGGRNSYEILKQVPVDFVKLDGAMMFDIHNNAVNRAKVEAICRVCSVIGLKTVAQFVENSGALQLLAEFGVDYAQGFGVAMPHSIDLLT
jgi:EAL domain-containing protein (putative c-di-GMP-specific phosphodiesterase class I)